VFLTTNYWPLTVYSSIFRHLLHVRRSVCMHVSAQLQLHELLWTLLLETFMKIRRETPNLDEYRTLYTSTGHFTWVPDTLHDYRSTFSFARRHKFAIHHFCAKIKFFLLWTVLRSSTTHREDIVAFPLLQWSRASAKMLLYTYRGADKSLVQPGRKQARATEDSEFHISYLLLQLEEY
jgi:hypothetical protein